MNAFEISPAMLQEVQPGAPVEMFHATGTGNGVSEHMLSEGIIPEGSLLNSAVLDVETFVTTNLTSQKRELSLAIVHSAVEGKADSAKVVAAAEQDQIINGRLRSRLMGTLSTAKEVRLTEFVLAA